MMACVSLLIEVSSTVVVHIKFVVVFARFVIVSVLVYCNLTFNFYLLVT